jgi:hypothetical protein
VQKDLSIVQPSERVSKARPQARDRALANATPIGNRRPFDSVTLCLHWATALLVLGMFASAWLSISRHIHTVRHACGFALQLSTRPRAQIRLTDERKGQGKAQPRQTVKCNPDRELYVNRSCCS